MAQAQMVETLGRDKRPFVPYISEEEVSDRTDDLARQILEDYEGRLIDMVHVAKGGVFWAVDLSRAMRRHDRSVQIAHHVVRLSSYGNGTKSSGIVRQHGRLDFETAGNNFLLVDEVVDEGHTLSHLVSLLRYADPEKPDSGPASVATAVLTDKRAVHKGRVPVNYPGFVVPDVFLVGVGMDYEQQGRESPYILQSATPEDVLATDYQIPPTISPFASMPEHPNGIRQQ